jgi:hypothetical protein
MIIDPTYGPQLDSKDGTLGKLKLVKRWVIVHPDLEMAALKKQYPKELFDIDLNGPMGWSLWFGRSEKTLATKEETEKLIKAFYANNPPGRVPEGLKAVPAWCYPGHLGFATYCE